MAMHRFKVLLEWDPESEAWVTYVPALDHLSTFGATRDEALANTQEAILGWIEAAEKEGLPVPRGSPKLELVDLEVATA
ncbi:MAG TPA: type II toxin-antitoxin system HicB family antitoxin [Chloroflexota bacterium]|nr:type II toxin-antitoxin system HicB family antitoxin [Chloroflexota bacterium]